MEGFLNPQEILKQLKLKESMVAADFGCGSGGWALPLAKTLEEGKVYAIDILEESLSALKAKIKLGKIFNIELIKSNVSQTSKLIPESCDLVLMTNLLFECEDKKRVLEEGKRVLKKGAKLLIVDWKLDAPLGPKEDRVSAKEIIKIAEEIGLKVEKPALRSLGEGGEFEAGIYHWGLILVK